MSSKLPGAGILTNSEITSITPLGFWLLVNDREYFVPFEDYPAFRNAVLSEIYEMQQIGPENFHWPSLDIDIELGALDQPEQFPLQFKP
jgi:hypothetical protein